jgi:hypothetical protein
MTAHIPAPVAASNPPADAATPLAASATGAHPCDLGEGCWAAPAHSRDCCEYDPRSCHPNNAEDRETAARLADAIQPQWAGYDDPMLDSIPHECENPWEGR